MIKLGLERIEILLKALGNPHEKVPPTVHVAGTNGKGSTIAFLRAILEDAGQSVHVYTSPHLVKRNERIRIAGHLISDEALKTYTKRVEAAALPDITPFEKETAIAFLAFSEHPADYLLLEVGLGGEKDATNVIQNPICTIITPVSIDHQDYLGDSLKEIAQAKAGIIKANCPVVIAPQPPIALDVISKKAELLNAPLYEAPPLDLPLPLIGAHQQINAGVAHKAASLLGFEGKNGLAKAQWEGRLQRLDWPGEVWLDGAHNQAGMEALADVVRAWEGPTIALVAILKNRNLETILPPLVPACDKIIALDMEDEQFHPPENYHKWTSNRCFFEKIPFFLQKMHFTSRILFCGSLYLGGRVLTLKGIANEQ